MKNILIMLVLLACTAVWAGNQVFVEMEIDSSYANTGLCADRDHVPVVYYLVNENVEPVVRDYADSTVVFYYEKNTQIGIIGRCTRCGELIGTPSWQKPLQKTTWRRDNEENNTDAIVDPSDAKPSGQK